MLETLKGNIEEALKRNIRLILEYDGGGYHGWQIQPGVRTIQQVVEEAIQRITQHPSRLTPAGRTDAGVHALQQVAHFHTSSRLDPDTLQRALNALLPEDIRILLAQEVEWSFHARFSALGKRYEYRIWNDRVASAFQHRYSWNLSSPLDLQAMEEASRFIKGRHDFSSFRSSNCDANNPIREVIDCGWRREGPLLVFWIEANAFLKYMVRSIVGTLVEVGLGKRAPEEIPCILMRKDRAAAGMTAPARGLFLTSVRYPPPWELDMVTIRGI